ncbi:hypothetical protein [Ferrovibrio sp.]|uniref:hypothetical protein n=1 Tax=Ferrovibrio sp. TaxID=1917215 RepID=UPI00351464AD
MARDPFFWLAWALYSTPFIAVLDHRHPQLWERIVAQADRFQVLLAGLLAIAAATIAYRGARAQAQSILEVQVRTQKEERRAIAAALHAEVNEIRLYLESSLFAMRKHPERIGRNLEYIPPTTEIFEALITSIGKLPPRDSHMVIMSRRMVVIANVLSQHLVELGEQGGGEVERTKFANFLDFLEFIIEYLKVTADGLAEISGNTRRRAAQGD